MISVSPTPEVHLVGGSLDGTTVTISEMTRDSVVGTSWLLDDPDQAGATYEHNVSALDHKDQGRWLAHWSPAPPAPDPGGWI